jgi:hypothetical protein
MKYSVLLLTLAVIVLFSCKKETTNINNAPLMMRVKNITGTNFSYVATAGKNFGAVANSVVTPYQVFDKIIAMPGAMVAADADTLYAGMGYCGMPPLPMLEDGKYTLEIFEDNSIEPGFLNAKFIKD